MMKLVCLAALVAPGLGLFKRLSCGNHRELCDNDIEPLGCFEQGPNTPWCHLGRLPQSMKEIPPDYHVFAPGQQRVSFPFDKSLSANIKKLKLDPSTELFFVSHGFGADKALDRKWVMPQVKALNALGHTVVVNDWHVGASPPNYWKAASNTRIVGAALAAVVKKFHAIHRFLPEKTTLIGFSLGTHVSGFAGARIRNLWRIIALDPAGPLFATNDPAKIGMNPIARLNHTDAKFVMCIHTDGFNLGLGGMGTVESMGKVDFLPNGGQVQPGCGGYPKKVFGNLAKFDFANLVTGVACPHMRADWLLTNMIENKKAHGCAIKAFPCAGDREMWENGQCTECPPEGCPEVGLDTPDTTQGRFFFETRAGPNGPAAYCGDQHRVTLSFDKPVKGLIKLTALNAAGKDISSTYEMHVEASEVDKIIATEFKTPIASIKVDYNKHDAWINRNDGPDSFKADVEVTPLPGSNGRKLKAAKLAVQSGNAAQATLA